MPVYSPHIGRVEMYETSGHFPYYRESQFPPLIGHPAGQTVDYWKQKLSEGNLRPEDEAKLRASANVCGCEFHDYPASGTSEERQAYLHKWEKTQERYLLKPMNCPHHIRIYASEQRSYRDLPIRLAEFGTVYRWEKSGELGGMTRVRGFTQDDAHLFCMEEQIPAEVAGCLELVKIVLGTLGMKDYRVRVGLRDPDSAKYVGDPAQWDRAEAACLAAAESLGVPFTKEPGEAAFYGPKIDFVVKDVIGREWQLGTVQVDYQLPQRFNLEYTGADNTPHRPVMIHRAPFGSMERFIGVLIEHFAGAFPLWLAPVQVAVLTVSEKTNDYAKQVAASLRDAGLRIELNDGNEKIGAKIRNATINKVPYMLVVGEKEIAEGKVAVRHRTEGDKGAVPVEEFIAMVTKAVAERV